MPTRVSATLRWNGLFGPYRVSRVSPATTVGRAKGRSMMAFTNCLPGNSSRTSTQAMTRPANELKAATASEQIRVSLRAATASGWLTACQKALNPLLKALDDQGGEREEHQQAEVGDRQAGADHARPSRPACRVPHRAVAGRRRGVRTNGEVSYWRWRHRGPARSWPRLRCSG